MKKLAAVFTAAGLSLFGAAFMFAAPAGATKPGEAGINLPNGTHIKVDVCHWANGHPHIVPVSVSAVTTSQNVKHGNLTLTESLSLGSFVAHDTPGHEEDWVARIYKKKGNKETNTYVSERECGADEPTTTTTQPPTTTTTEPPVTTTTTVPPVTTTTQPPVTTTTEPPAVTTTTQPPVVTGTQCVDANGFAYTTSLSECPAKADTPLPGDIRVSENPPITALPHTGAWSLFLALLGAAAGLTGLGLMLFSRSLRRAEDSV